MRKLGALIFPGFELLDLFGPMEMFGMMNEAFELHLVAEDRGPVASGQTLSAHATLTLDDAKDLDILFVPGGPGTRREIANTRLLDWIAATATRADHVLSVCTGSALLAKAGVLDGRRATTNKAAFGWVMSQGPEVDWQKQARWVEDGKCWSSSGVSAGMDMALAFIARLHGDAVAQDVAKFCEYERHEDPARDPFAELHGLV